MTRIDARWPFSGRREEVTAIRAAILSAAGCGVVIVGPPGVGKTTTAQHAVDGLSRDDDPVHLRGTAAQASTQYAALNVLLADLDEETAESPLLVLSALQRRFGDHGTGQPTLVHIDRVEDIDASSAAVMAHLARTGAVRLIVTSESLLRAPDAFLDLWKDDQLERVDVRPLTLEATTELLAAALDAPVSRSAAQELWVASGGSPRHLQLVTRADLDAGQLVLQDGVWVARHVPRRATGRSVVDWLTADLAALLPSERTVIEVLAVCGPLPVRILLRAVQSTSLDALQADGTLTLADTDEPVLGLTHGLVADTVLADLVSSPGVLALEALNRLRDDPGMPVRGRTAIAVWALGHGIPIADEDLVGLAGLANDHGLGALAGHLLDGLDPDRTTPRAVLERARSLWSDGRGDDALTVVENLLLPELPDDGLPEWVDTRLLASWLLRSTDGRDPEARALLDDVGVRLQRHPTDDDLQGKLDLAVLESDVFDGALTAACERAPAILARWSDASHRRVGISSILSAARAGMGAQEEAASSMEAVLVRLMDTASNPQDRDTAVLGLCSALFMAGRWNECLELLRSLDGRAAHSLLAGSPLESLEGVLLAFLGRSSEALEKLVPAISQFRLGDQHGLLPLAKAAAAYASVLEGDPDDADEYLRNIDLTGRRYPWYLREAVLYFRLLTDAWLDTSDAVSVELLDHARSLADSGRRGVELFFLCQAVQLGRYEAADALAASATASQGPFSRLAQDLAKGLASHDPGMLKQAALEALGLGNNNLAGDLAGLSIEYLTETDDPMILVHAEQTLRKTATPARRHVRRQLLSERERAIARQVALGVANREIAEQEHISPRTVEGHVHQIMSKLGLSSRKQLSLIFGRKR